MQGRSRTLESSEDYLETIYELGQRLGEVRAIDIVRELGYSKPSISRAMGVLRGLGYIAIDDKHCISLTDQGLIKAQAIYERHKIITAFLVQLGVDAATAERDACRIEHDISQQTFECIKLATNIQ